MRLKWTTVPDYIFIDDMLIFFCLLCLSFVLIAIFPDGISTDEISRGILQLETFDV